MPPSKQLEQGNTVGDLQLLRMKFVSYTIEVGEKVLNTSARNKALLNEIETEVKKVQESSNNLN